MPLSRFCPRALVIEIVVIPRLSAILCRTLPQSAKVCIIIKLKCRGIRIIFLSLFCFSLFCPQMSCFTRVSGVMVKCSEIIDCGRTEQKTARCYCLLVVKLVVKRSGLLCRSCKSCNPLNKRIPRLPILFCCK